MTTGAPSSDVTVLIPSSVGANAILAIKSEYRQKTAPDRKQAGTITGGRELRRSFRILWA